MEAETDRHTHTHTHTHTLGNDASSASPKETSHAHTYGGFDRLSNVASKRPLRISLSTSAAYFGFWFCRVFQIVLFTERSKKGIGGTAL